MSYEVTYRVNNSNLVVVNSTGASTRFSISSLTPMTRVSDISVSAFTIKGQGGAVSVPDIVLSQPREL